jgi:hypothetical protein
MDRISSVSVAVQIEQLGGDARLALCEVGHAACAVNLAA